MFSKRLCTFFFLIASFGINNLVISESGYLSEKELDDFALNYCDLKNTSYIALVFPAGKGNDASIEALFNQYGNIVCKKIISLSVNGACNLIKHIYNGEGWIGTKENNFSGAQAAAQHRFPQGGGVVRVYVIESETFEKIIECKRRIRMLFTVGNAAIHINDTHTQTRSVARVIFNKNGLHFLNFAHPQRFPKFEKFLAEYKAWLSKNPVNTELFCVDSSAILSAYGIRDCQDLDFLHLGYDDIAYNTGNPSISSHNSSLHHHVYKLDDIVLNPDHYFYYQDIKFCSLDVVKKMKQKRNEVKDKDDVKLIEALLAK